MESPEIQYNEMAKTNLQTTIMSNHIFLFMPHKNTSKNITAYLTQKPIKTKAHIQCYNMIVKYSISFFNSQVIKETSTNLKK